MLTDERCLRAEVAMNLYRQQAVEHRKLGMPVSAAVLENAADLMDALRMAYAEEATPAPAPPTPEPVPTELAVGTFRRLSDGSWRSPRGVHHPRTSNTAQGLEQRARQRELLRCPICQALHRFEGSPCQRQAPR